MNAPHAAETAVTTARRSYGRLLSWLAWKWADIAAAEDALADAFEAALRHWPTQGVPDSPEAWLMTAAKRNLIKTARRRRLAEDPELLVLFPDEHSTWTAPSPIPDDRLRLLLVCAHPAIEVSVQTALMLQVVLGVDAARIAEAFLVTKDAMTKRLVRAKSKIKAAAIRFEEPQAEDLPLRLEAVLEAIYGAYALDHTALLSDTPAPLAEEALFLAQLVATQLPQQAEALGLHALLLLCEARRPAQQNTQGEFVPLLQQDASRWDQQLIRHGFALLEKAAQQQQPGPFQLEAAIQAAHCSRARTGTTPWGDIVQLYRQLLTLHPTTGAQLAYAIALSQAAGDPQHGLAYLAELDAGALNAHQPWWAAQAYLFACAGRLPEAIEAYEQAAARTHHAALRQYLLKERNKLRGQLH